MWIARARPASREREDGDEAALAVLHRQRAAQPRIPSSGSIFE
jgi:hypothetical protein